MRRSIMTLLSLFILGSLLFVSPRIFASSGRMTGPASPQAASLTLNKTVGTNPLQCATTDQIEVAAGTEVTYCYTVTNTGDENLNSHTLVDSELGALLTNFPYSLSPAASAFLTESVVLNASVTNTATWSALTSNQIQASDDDTATVNVIPPSLTLNKTVGADPLTCASTDQIEVTPGTEVTYCYTVTNTGLTNLVSHNLEDSELGALLTNFPYSLVPSASAFLTESVVLNASVTNTATWTALTSYPIRASDDDTATVTVRWKGYLPLVSKNTTP